MKHLPSLQRLYSRRKESSVSTTEEVIELHFGEMENEEIVTDECQLQAIPENLNCGSQETSVMVPVKNESVDCIMEDRDGCVVVMERDANEAEDINELHEPHFVAVKEEDPDDKSLLYEEFLDLNDSTEVSNTVEEGKLITPVQSHEVINYERLEEDTAVNISIDGEGSSGDYDLVVHKEDLIAGVREKEHADESLEELENNTSRIRRRNISFEVDEPPKTTDSGQNTEGNTEMLQERAVKRTSRERKRTVQTEMNSLPKRTTIENQEVAELKDTIKSLQRCLQKQQNSNAQINALKMFIGEQFQSLKEEFRQQIAELKADIKNDMKDLHQGFEEKLKQFEHLRPLRNSHDTASATEISSYLEEEVDLGQGFKCSRRNLEKLEMIENDHSGWATMLLKCAFGPDAHLYRVKPTRKTGNRTFPEEFICMAKLRYREWMKKQRIVSDDGKELVPKYSESSIQRLCDSLPAYLSKRAEDLKGPRGIHKRVRAVIEKGGDPADILNDHKRKRSQVASKRRKGHTRRGSLPLLSATPQHSSGLPNQAPASTTENNRFAVLIKEEDSQMIFELEGSTSGSSD